MRLSMVAILSVAAGFAVSKPAPAQAPAPFDGGWMTCEEWQGSEICEYKLLAQHGDRVCGLQSYFATNAYYEQRFVGTARGNMAHIDRICGDPGSETDSYCEGQAPNGAEKVGWEATDQTLYLCNGELIGAAGDGAVSCAGVEPGTGMPRARSLGDHGPDDADRAWLASCAAGAE